MTNDERQPLTESLQTSLFNVSTSSLEAELARRQNGSEVERPPCGSGPGLKSYNTSLHVVALVIILILSTLACSFPILVRRFPRLPVPHRFLFISRHFGTGVLIATAFVHLLPTAFTSLTDPCLPPFWNKGYPAMPGFIAMISVMVVVSIEMFFAAKGARHSHGGDYGILEPEVQITPPGSAGLRSLAEAQVVRPNSTRRFRQGSIGYTEAPQHSSSITLNESKQIRTPGRTSLVQGLYSTSQVNPFEVEEDRDSEVDLDDFDEVDPVRSLHKHEIDYTTKNGHHHDLHTSCTNANYTHDENTISKDFPAGSQQDEQRLLLQCLLLEAGILFHSVFIGMALSVATGASFVVLLVAISFHQTFEGLALGSRIAAINSLGPRSLKPWLMALAYGTTTPIGQAIGLLVHNMYDPLSETGLLMVGFMNAISSGLLLFAGLVELLAEDFLADKSYQTLFGRKRLEACLAVFAGSMLMALVGAWA